MIISDIDYLESIAEADAMHLSGGYATALSQFSAFSFGNSTSTSTVIKNKAVNGYRGISFASSNVSSTSAASGDNTITGSSASSASSVG